MPDLQKIVADSNSDPRVKVLAYNRLLASGHKPEKKELLVFGRPGIEYGGRIDEIYNRKGFGERKIGIGCFPK